MSASSACTRLPRAFQRALGQSRRRVSDVTAPRAACKLSGVGSCVPPSVLTNDDLAQIVETSDDWISARTGIRRRHVLSKSENLTDYAIESARKALEMSGTAPNEVDMVLLATSSPDDIFGSATQVQYSAHTYVSFPCRALPPRNCDHAKQLCVWSWQHIAWI